MVFTDQAGIPDTVFIGSRDTSPIYFLQLMVRYGLIWGRIAPGDDHEMGHFLEKDMPGLIVICADLPPLKYLITLGLMKLGAPAIVPCTFPFPYGYRLVADSVAEILERISHLPNLRQRYYLDEVIGLPAPCNPALDSRGDSRSAAASAARPARSSACGRRLVTGERLRDQRGTGRPAGNPGGHRRRAFQRRHRPQRRAGGAARAEHAARRARLRAGGRLLPRPGRRRRPGRQPSSRTSSTAGIRLEYPRLRDIATE